MSIALRAAQGSNNAGGGTSITMTYPTGMSAGDVMLMALTVRGGSGTTIDEPPVLNPWTSQTTPFSTTFGSAVAFANSIFVATAQGPKIATSTNGTSWTSRTNPFGGSTVVNCVGYGNGLWVAAGGSGTVTEVATAPDPTSTWTLQTAPWSGNGPFANGVAYGNGVWVMVGNDNNGGLLATSTNGTTWSSQTNPFGTEFANCVIFADGKFVAGTASGATNSGIYTSTDGVSWAQQTSSFASGDTLKCLGWGNGLYVAGTASNHKIGTSADGVNWTQQTSPFTGATSSIGGVTYANDIWTAVATAEIATSSDGLTWAKTSSPASYVGEDLAFGAGLWVTVGWVSPNSAIYTSDDPNGTPGWQPLGAVTNSTTVIAQKAWSRKVISADVGSSISMSWGGATQKASGVIIALSGADTTLPASSQYGAQANASSTTITAPSLSLGSSMTGMEVVFSGTATGTTIAPVTLTEPANGESASTGNAAGSRTTTEVEYGTFTGTTPPQQTSTASAAAVNIGHHIFIKEAATPVSPPGPYRPPYVQIIR